MDNYRDMIEIFDKNSFYTDSKIDRDIDNNRKGGFRISFIDPEGNPVKNVRASIRQVSHDFKFGCSLFLLDQFDDEHRNSEYRRLFSELFNYAVIPLYWDTLEPTKGKPRFGKDSERLWRRPAIDLMTEFCTENSIRMKGHCLMYHSFNPDWLPTTNREFKMAVDKRLSEIGEHCGKYLTDVDVINELHSKYKNLYGISPKLRNFPIMDEKDSVNWCFERAKHYFPFSRLFWNEGCNEIFGNSFCGDKSYFYLMLKRYLNENVPIEGIGMQFHAYDGYDDCKLIFNPLRLLDLFELYSEFGLPYHISEISIPSYSNNADGEEIQAELTKRLFRLWFSTKNNDAIVWWNLVDGTAYGDENRFFAGLLRNDMTPKPAYNAIKELLSKTWHTELTAQSENGEILFNGFYGDYEIEAEYNGKKAVRRVSCLKENTGYFHNAEYGFGFRPTLVTLD